VKERRKERVRMRWLKALDLQIMLSRPGTHSWETV